MQINGMVISMIFNLSFADFFAPGERTNRSHDFVRCLLLKVPREPSGTSSADSFTNCFRVSHAQRNGPEKVVRIKKHADFLLHVWRPGIRPECADICWVADYGQQERFQITDAASLFVQLDQCHALDARIVGVIADNFEEGRISDLRPHLAKKRLSS